MRMRQGVPLELDGEQLEFLVSEAERLEKTVPDLVAEIVDAYMSTHDQLNSAVDDVVFSLSDETQTEQPRLFPSRRRRNILPFGWYGGKYSHLKWLLPLLPEAHHFCEPFCGSAVVTLNRAPSPVETVNDVDSELTNFFRVLREDKERLISSILLTPFSREELARAAEEAPEQYTPLERARRFFVCARQVRTGLAQTASEGRWATCRKTSRAGMSGAVSRWLGSIAGLWDVAERLMRIQIENRPALQVIEQYDCPETLFYCDPPYPHDSRGDTNAYGFEMDDQEHIELAQALNSLEGKAAVSGYRCEFMDSLYEGWTLHEAPAKKCHSSKDMRTEVLWTNY